MNTLRIAAVGMWAAVCSIVRRVFIGERTPSRSRRMDVLVDVIRATLPILIKGDLALLRGKGFHSAVQRQVDRRSEGLNGVAASCFEPQSAADGPVTLFFHGGGYVIGSVGSHRDFLSRLCLATRGPVWAIDYRLAPEHPFPAAIEDAVAAYRALLADGISPEQLVVAGDSAGGGLCVALLLELQRLGEPLPAAAALVSPWIDHRSDYASFESCTSTDYLTAKLVDHWSAQYRGDREVDVPLISPIHAELAGLPPFFIQWGEAEVLRDGIEAFAKRAEAFGVEVTTDCAPGMPHDWAALAALVPEGQPAIERLAAFGRQVVNLNG